MKKNKKTYLSIPIAGFLLFLGYLFHSFLLNNFITPLALVFWILWKIFLSVDQKYYWVLIIISASFYVFLRITQKGSSFERSRVTATNATLENMNYWRTSILVTSDEIDRPNILKQDLTKMLVEIYANKSGDASQIDIYNAIKMRQVPLPDSIYGFLFQTETSGAESSFNRVLHSITQTPRKLIRRWTGRDVAEYYQSIENVLNYIETLMEN
jgi:hypothetical protein